MVNYPVAQENSEIVVETLSDRLQLFDDKVMHAFENAFKLIDFGKKLSSIEIKPEYKELIEKLLLAYGSIPISNIDDDSL